MCAINGFNFKNEDLILKMNRATSHRGPDGTGVFLDDDISLGHNRLSIIDLSDRASQPMESFDKEQVIIFNGEIYNFKELKKELKNYPFKTESDTEVILAAYKKWGHGCVEKLNGIFAFAVWDKKKKELFLARDHIGVKPLYYFWKQGKFIFSSEIKAILKHNVPRILDQEAFNNYLRVLYAPEPLTMFKDIRKLPPASFAVLKEGELDIKKYWERGAENPVNYLKETKKEIKEILADKVLKSVESQIVSDKPLGIYLSGGIDSSAVLHSMARLRGGIDTFSVGFELSLEEEEEKFNADFNLAKRTAKHYGANHHEVLIGPAEAAELFEKTIWHMDEPISNPTAIAMMKLASFAKGRVDVVLGGDGGDELFGGYERYRLSLIADYYRKFPAVLRTALNFSKRLKKLNIAPGAERFALFMFQKDDVLNSAVNNEFLSVGTAEEFFEKKYFSDFSDKKFTEIFMDTDRKSWLVDESLARSDKMSMSAGLEARVPLLDKELTEFAARIPLKYKVNPFNTKIIFKEAFRGRIPSFLLNQPKRGWFSPGAKWLRHPEFYSMAMEAFSAEYYDGTSSLFNWDEVRSILKNHCEKKKYNLTILWSILSFQIWAKKYNIKVNDGQ